MFKNIFYLVLVGVLVFNLSPVHALAPQTGAAPRATWWSIQSIDTMKESRDLAREKLNDSHFDTTIDAHVALVAKSGATHIAIGTPYDDEFLPYLKRWVAAARTYGLLVWYRGNWSGWEGWFDYSDIDRSQHIEKTKTFILAHPELFVDGDLFSACPECENGGPGDPRQTGDIIGHRQFLMDLYAATSGAFRQIQAKVQSNLFSMNGDVAEIIMDEPTTAALGGIVVVDHYVDSPEKFISDLKKYARISHGKVIVGEFGAPIPDLNGNMTPAQQDDWLKQVLDGMAANPDVVGVNYWTGFGASTRVWDDLKPRPAATTLHAYFTPSQVLITAKNALNQPVTSASVSLMGRQFFADDNGVIRVALLNAESTQLQVVAPGFASQGILVGKSTPMYDLTLQRSPETLAFKLRKLIYRLLHGII